MELIDKSKLLEELKRCEKICENYISSHKDAVSQGIANAKRVVCQHFIKFIDTLEVHHVPESVYVVTRSEEHSDYVESVFLNEDKAKEYCKPYNEDEDSYARNITKVKIQ